MKDYTRAAIAYIAGRIISGTNSSSIYDYSKSTYINISGSIERNTVNVYDYSQSCHISGTYNSLYHYGDSHYINLNINGNQFDGYDYGHACHFSGNVSGNSISLYDYGTSSNYRYSL